MIRSIRAFPIILALLLGILSFWLDSLTQLGFGSIGINKKNPEYTGENVSTKLYDAQGNIKHMIEAKTISEHEMSPDMHFTNARVKVYDKNQLIYRLESGALDYNKQNDFAFLSNHVLFTKISKSAQDAILSVQADNIHANLAQKTLTSTDLLHFKQGHLEGQSQGFNYFHKTQYLDLLANVRIQYAP